MWIWKVGKSSMAWSSKARIFAGNLLKRSAETQGRTQGRIEILSSIIMGQFEATLYRAILFPRQLQGFLIGKGAMEIPQKNQGIRMPHGLECDILPQYLIFPQYCYVGKLHWEEKRHI